MAKSVNILVDTDIWIDYFNHHIFRELFETSGYQVYYSVVTKKELLSKKGLSTTESKIILQCLKRYKMLPLNSKLLQLYSKLRIEYPKSHKEDTLIAATAIIHKMPLATRNTKHFRVFKELRLFYQL